MIHIRQDNIALTFLCNLVYLDITTWGQLFCLRKLKTIAHLITERLGSPFEDINRQKHWSSFYQVGPIMIARMEGSPMHPNAQSTLSSSDNPNFIYVTIDIISSMLLSNYNRWLTFDKGFAHPDPTVPGAFQVGQIGKQSLEQFVRGERFFFV